MNVLNRNALNGWKAIAAYLRRDERTAMRWAAERGMPVHRTPGPGRGSVYALAGEIDAWLAADREAPVDAGPSVPAIVEPAEPPLVVLSPLRWWRRRWVTGALVGLGALLMATGALTLHASRTTGTTSDPAFADPATKALFLQARYDWNLRTPEGLTRAVHEYGETIARDPRVPAAYVGLAESYLLLREYGSLPDAVAYPRAQAAARAAAALSPDNAEAQRALGFIAFWWNGDHRAARHAFARSLALKPDDPLTHHWLANALAANGEAAAALREIDRARDLDPVATSILANRGLILYMAGHRAEGLASLRALAAEQPEAMTPHRSIAEIALFEARPDEFLRESATIARLRSDRAALAAIARWRAAAPAAGGVAGAMLATASPARTGWFPIARLAAVTGRPDEAKDALARSCAAREPAAISAPGDLWLSHALTPADIAERCRREALS